MLTKHVGLWPERAMSQRNLAVPGKLSVLSRDSRKNFGQPQKIAKILKKVPFASFSFVAAITQILDLFYE